ncbi:MAG TPA: hypothetical protein VK028_00830 [Micromonosporaceae bacterium]|nr:hypothetical protein [Micromonosporaceae bacterium]
MTSVLHPELFDALHDFVRLQVAAGYTPADQIVDDAVEEFAERAGDLAALRSAAKAITERALANHLAEQASWEEQTDCDRLDAAFAELDANGIVARQHFSCCGLCGNQEIKDVMDQVEKSGQTVRGFTFFHVQDTAHAVAGESLYLSYGSADADGDAVAIGHEVVGVLERHGLKPWWNGKRAHRIALPLTWRRRR